LATQVTQAQGHVHCMQSLSYDPVTSIFDVKV